MSGEHSMKTLALAVGAAALVLSAGSAALAAKSSSAKGATAMGPSQPIPYPQLDAYLKASPKERASKDWWSGASTGAGTDTAATTTAPSASSSPSAAPTESKPEAAPPEGSSTPK
jgi:hypothetical protein